MLKKIKRTFTAIISAVLCVSMALGITASAADADVWKETKALTSLKYNSNYIKWAEKYSEKDAKNTVTYEKSRTKKFLDRLQKEAAKESPEYTFGLIGRDSMMCYAFKKNCFKGVSLMGGECNILYLNNNAMTAVSAVNKTKSSLMTYENEDDYNEIQSAYTEKYSADTLETFNFDLAENTIGKLFKFKSNEKIYFYEEFDAGEYYGNVGFLFTEKGTPLAMYINDRAFCVDFKTTVDDSEFDIPKGYKNVDFDDFEY